MVQGFILNYSCFIKLFWKNGLYEYYLEYALYQLDGYPQRAMPLAWGSDDQVKCQSPVADFLVTLQSHAVKLLIKEQ